MTALEILIDPDTQTDALDEAPLVRWEPCAVFAGPEPQSCATCGWLAADHAIEGDAEAHGDDSVRAIVVALPTRPVLRRAS